MNYAIMTEPVKNQIVKSLEEMHQNGITSWPGAVVAILHRFGLGVGAAMGLVGVLGFISWILWGHSVAQNAAIQAAHQAQVAQLETSSAEKSEIIRLVTTTLNENTSAINRWTKSIDDMTLEMRRQRYSVGTPQ